MSIGAIIFLWICFVCSIAFLFIYKTITKPDILRTEKDIFHAWYDKKALELERAECSFSMDTYIKIMLIAPIILFFVIYVLTNNTIVSFVGIVAGVFLPDMIVKSTESSNLAKFDVRYSRSLQQLASSLRAGMSILESVQDVAECKFVHESIRKKYAAMAMDLQMGTSVSDAFHNFADKVNSKDALDVAIAIDVQNEVGGHEADVIEEIANNIHRRIMLRKEVKTLFSGTSSMVWIMDFLPPGVCIFYLATNREMMNTYLSSNIMIALLIALFAMMGIGSLLNHHSLKKVLKGE